MYKVASQNRQRAVDQTAAWQTLATGGEEARAPEEERRDLQRALRALDEIIIQTANPSERRALGQQKQALQDRQAAIKKLVAPTRSGIESYFILAAKERLARPVLDAIWQDAKRLYDERAGMDQEASA